MLYKEEGFLLIMIKYLRTKYNTVPYWSIIIIGLIITYAVSIFLSLTLSAFTGYKVSPALLAKLVHHSDAFQGWADISIILLSFLIGGVLTGMMAGACGYLHGFLMWGLALIIMLITGLIAPKMTMPDKPANQAYLSQMALPRLQDKELNISLQNLSTQLNYIFNNASINELKADKLESIVQTAEQLIEHANRDIKLYPNQKNEIIANLANKLDNLTSAAEPHINLDKVVPLLKIIGLKEEDAQAAADKGYVLYKQAVVNLQQRLQDTKNILLQTQAELSNKWLKDSPNTDNSYVMLSETIQEVPAAAPVKQKRWLGYLCFILSAIIATLAGRLGEIYRNRYWGSVDKSDKALHKNLPNCLQGIDDEEKTDDRSIKKP